uniref:disks large homolog 5-like isoform X2 n=1 Tax=Arvicanthis niloticus TaxID=61156 RepID=UPI001486D215|nr:disks large homolog 5-like isoform X2 [Arvicanthis niloticus]
MLEETGFYPNLHSQLLMEQSQLMKKVNMLKQENRKIREHCDLVLQHLGKLKLICKNQQEDTSDHQTQQQQGLERMEELLQDRHKQKDLGVQEKESAGKLQHHFELLQKSCFLTELNQLKKKVDMMRQENKTIQGRCARLQQHLEDLTVSKQQQEEASDLLIQLQKHMERMEEMLQYVLKQKEMAIKQKELAEKMQHHFEVLQMRSEKLQHEMELATAQKESVLQNDLLHQEPPAEPHP